MGAAAIPLAAFGAVSSFIQGNRAQNQAQQGLNIANQQAQRQSQLFGQAQPVYGQLLGALQQNAGIGSHGDQLSQGILGQGATPADLARYNALNQQLQQSGLQAMHNAQFDMGRRGLANSSLDASQNAAIASNMALGGTQLRSELANEAQQNYANRLNQLYQALSPGLAAGTGAGQLGLGIGQQAFGQAGVFGSQLANALQNYLQYHAMQQYLSPGGGGGNAALGNQAYNAFAGAGLGNTQDLGGGYSVTLPDGFNFG